jgi:predicted RNA-binding Zn-ribbon protein involved in translation (DUF1610 family)
MRIIKIATREPFVRFDCPLCSAPSFCDICYLGYKNNVDSEAVMLICRACGKGSIWKRYDWKDNYNYNLKLIEPIIPDAPPASLDMPDDVKTDYNEARMVVNYSTRAAAALLRLALQKLCRHLGEPGENLNDDIRSLAKKPEFGDRLIKAADTVRIVGNNAVHPGEMNQEDIDNICKGLFGLLNLVVESGITHTKKWDKMYESLPENPRKDAEKRDKR